ncbi:unnamed protein product [Moneuplotes crassus]|uniref:ABC transporter domain-containing protein n=1 Tax=Euplotes crassus TaxID=5936 RepID=A0AAD1U6Y3_EUPCR|nr:unnamed protein product [Moneuplotes crassus]
MYQYKQLLVEKDDYKSVEMKLSWHNLTYTVKTKSRGCKNSNSKEKTILKLQSGSIKPGQACFIMGSSGAGKTTLLNALCDRLTNSKSAKLQGQVLINDTHSVRQSSFGKYGAYVMQDDVLFPTLTCEEVITFSARLKLILPPHQISARVDTIIEDLGLNNCRHTFIGNQLIKGLSGGERKRTAIGIELVTDPQILCLDEPTSGLDSFTAHKIVKLLVSQAKLGKTVVATIHQPSSQAFGLFDKLILLMDGHQIYQGAASQSVEYFESIGFSVPSYSNPADYFLQKFYMPFNKSEEDVRTLEILTEAYKTKLSDKNGMAKQIRESDTGLEEAEINEFKEYHSSVSFCTELRELLRRTVKNTYRNPTHLKLRFVASVMISVIVCFFFWDLGYDAKGVKNKIGFMFFMSVDQTMQALFSVAMNFIDERPIFLREYASKTYGIWSYFLSKSVIEAPFQLLFPFLASLIVYFAAGLTPEFDKLMIFSCILVSVVFFGTSLGFAIGCSVTDPMMVTTMVIFLLGPMLFCGGYFVNLHQIPVYTKWISHLSPIRYCGEALLRHEFLDNPRYVHDPTLFTNFGFELGLTKCIYILLGLGIAFRAVGIIMLRLAVVKVQ